MNQNQKKESSKDLYSFLDDSTKQKLLPNDIEYFDIIDSTNTYLKENNLQKHPLVVVANAQTCGRGRMGRSFYSPEKTGLYMSLKYLCKTEFNPARFTISAAVAVCRALKKIASVDPQIKWVNDIYLEGKKICGILCEGIFVENFSNPFVIIGIGVNISTKNFPQELENKAGCLLQTENADVNSIKIKLCGSILDELFNVLSFIEKTGDFSAILTEYKSFLFVLCKNVSVVSCGETYQAFAKDILDDGSLLVEKLNGEDVMLNSGEISILV